MVSTAAFAALDAFAAVTVPPVALIAASPPMANPDPRRNVRRSTDVFFTSERILARWERRATPLVFFLNIVISLAVL
jgi:hypothetical protein